MFEEFVFYIVVISMIVALYGIFFIHNRLEVIEQRLDATDEVMEAVYE